MKVAVYPGSFDPTTNGHLDIINRASRLCDKLIVGVLDNKSKVPLFTVEERVVQLKEITKDFANVEIKAFSGLLVDFARANNSNIVIRGLRGVTDFSYEFQMALTNRALDMCLEHFLFRLILNICFSAQVRLRNWLPLVAILPIWCLKSLTNNCVKNWN